MDMWIIWPAGIAIWLTVGWVVFAVFETLGIKHNNTGGYLTLSYFVYRVTQAWGPAEFLIGVMVGGFWCGLAVHFWWHWCPPGSVSTGMLLLPFTFN